MRRKLKRLAPSGITFLAGMGFALSDFRNVWVAYGCWIGAGVWLLFMVPSIERRIPFFIKRRIPFLIDGKERSWIEAYEIQHGKLPPLPDYLVELFGNYSSGPISKGMIPITPSGQKWNSLLPSQQKEWRQVVEWLGKDPEDLLTQMRRMFPKNPPGIEKKRWKPPEQH